MIKLRTIHYNKILPKGLRRQHTKKDIIVEVRHLFPFFSLKDKSQDVFKYDFFFQIYICESRKFF